ncbi:MFS transporter [Lactobacillus sp. ESL0684]|uniref:MFS transporter n=1 Tax=Lactobacillus sp. ESL0684 TaxID=2983213 RepID=UPI0023F999B6|nr:MFS transporter [Lactobacillus sp. ESL0684]WEV43769.1 MFS transporter [Lactobacillus sp. ESL0684]
MDIFLRNKNYRKLSVASWLSGAGNILFYLALMTYASKLKNYSLALSLIAIMEAIPNLLSSIGGYFADRTKNKYHVIVTLALIRCALYLVVGLLFASNLAGWNLVLLVIGLNFISDLAGTYSGGLSTPLIVDLVGQNDLAEAEGFTNGINQVITMLAQFIGSGLLLFMSYTNLAIVNAVTFLISGLLYLNVGRNYQKQQPINTNVNQQSFWATLKSSYHQVKTAHGLLTIVLVFALLNGILSTIEPLLSILVAGNKSMLVGTYSFTIALFGALDSIGMALGSAIGTKIFKQTSLFIISLLDTLASIAMVIALLTKNMLACLVFGSLLGFFAGVGSPKLSQWLITSVDHDILASSVGMLNTILLIAGPLMTTIFTSIAGTTRVNYALYGIIAVSIGVFIVTLAVMHSAKQKQ